MTVAERQARIAALPERDQLPALREWGAELDADAERRLAMAAAETERYLAHLRELQARGEPWRPLP